ncbi:MAG: hypothetical protein WCD42_13925, partial [Rhizomicrobium sp.]
PLPADFIYNILSGCPVSLRHKVTTVLRIAGVPEDQISRQRAHAFPDFSNLGTREQTRDV